MSEQKKWVGYADLLEAKRKREERERSVEQQNSEIVSQATETSQVLQTSQVTQASPPKETRQAQITPEDRPEARQVTETRQPQPAVLTPTSVNLMSSLPDVRGHTRFQHQIVDHLYPQLDAYEQVVHFHLYRLSWGYNKPTCIISLQKLSERAGLSYKSAQRSVNNLERRGLISRQGRVIGYGKEQGIEFWVAPAPNQVTEARQVSKARQVLETDNKKKDNYVLKETTHTKAGPKIQGENERASRGVGVGSRFSLEECLRYAEHLQRTGQGITNPGGFAMTIFRSGVADGLIEKFLNPPAESGLPDVSACPDCQGTGIYYPDGFDKGVAKCRHERLKDADADDERRPVKRLSPEEMSERVLIISELLENGYTFDQAEEQFAGGFHPDDWTAIRKQLEGREAAERDER